MTVDDEAQHPLIPKSVLDDRRHDSHDLAPPRRWVSAPLLVVVGVVAGLILGELRSYGKTPLDPPHRWKTCSTTYPSVTAPRANPWKNLEVDEAVTLRRWLHAPGRGLNLTDMETARDSDNFIHLVETYPPPKDEVLRYLDGDGSVKRYARAIINEGTRNRVMDYLIGPLPVSRKTTIRENTEIYHAPVPLNARSTVNFVVLGQLVGEIMVPLDDILRDLFNVSVAEQTVTISGEFPLSYDGTWRRTWVQLKRNLPGKWIRPIDFYYLVDMSGTDERDYRPLAFVTGGKLYQNASELRAAWEGGKLTRDLDYDGGDWASRSIRGEMRDLDDRAGPRSVLVDGARWRLDPEEGYITWMGWALYTSFYRDMGLHLWDVRFRGERIIYELAPQEALAQYSGSDPHQGSTVWLDRAFGMGGLVREVMLGYDCPAYASLLNATVHEGGSTRRRGAVCVFEREAERPLSRHTSKDTGEMGTVKGYELVIRSISTVGNYDYIFDYVLQLDGSIEVRVSASGYLQGGSWSPSYGTYGHQIQRGSMGSLHDHVINYKIDLDVAGVRNSLMRVSLGTETLDTSWTDVSGWGSSVQTKIMREIISRESVLEYPPNSEGSFVVVNKDSHNAWGNPRGYAVHPGPLCRMANVSPLARRAQNSVNWAKHHLAVTVRHENEPSSSTMWNGNLPGAPPVNFYRFFNDENIEQQDLVLWANLGMHHIPRAEDSPNTLTNVATSYLLLVPFNFNDFDVAMESHNSVVMKRELEGGAWEVKEGVRQPQCVVPPPQVMGYHGLEGWREDGTPYTPIEIEEIRTCGGYSLVWNLRGRLD